MLVVKVKTVVELCNVDIKFILTSIQYRNVKWRKSLCRICVCKVERESVCGISVCKVERDRECVWNLCV